MRDDLGIRAVADGDADGAAGDVRPVLHGKRPRAHDRRLGLIVVRANEANLAIALGVVAHGGHDDVDAIVGEQGDAGGRIDTGEDRLDTKALGHRACHIDIVAAADVAFARAEQRIVFAHAGPDPVLAEGADQPVDVGGGTGTRHRSLGTGILDELRERHVGCLGRGRQDRERGSCDKQQNPPDSHLRSPFRQQRFPRCASRRMYRDRGDIACAHFRCAERP